MLDQSLSTLITHSHLTGDDREGMPTDKARQINAILSAIDSACLSDEMLSLPIQHYVSVSDTCNVKCHYCPRQSYYGDRWENGFLPFEQFEERIIPLARVADTMGLYGLGEPFLHRRFFDFVRASKAAGTEALTNNHGMSLKPKVNEQIIESGLDVLNVSMDGATEETFNRLRHPAKFDIVCSNVRDLVARRDEARSRTPKIQVAAMINRHNIHEIPDMVRMAKDLGAARIDFSDTIICNPAEIEDSVSGMPVMYRQIDEAKRVGGEIDIQVQYSLQKPFPWRPLRPDEQSNEPLACELAWSTWLVGKHGQVNPCCFIEWEFGNAFRDDPERIRNGEEAKALRRRLMSGNLPRECHGCGCARPLTELHQRTVLDRAEALLSEADRLTENETFDLRRLITERRALVDERWGGNRSETAEPLCASSSA